MNAVMDTLPSTVIGKSNNADDIEFLLFANPRNKNEYSTLVMNVMESLPQPPSDYIKTTKVLIPGLGSHALCDFPKDVKNAYLGNPEGPNVIIVNWGRLASPSWVPGSVSRCVETVGRHVGKFLNWLIDSTSLNPLNIHIVGHSAGCHIAGLAANIVNDEQKQKPTEIGRISALHPAKPKRWIKYYNRTLDKNDAKFVDAYYFKKTFLHTNRNDGIVNFYIKLDSRRLGNLTGGRTRETVHSIFAKTISGGPGTYDVTEQAKKSDKKYGKDVSVVKGPIELGEHCASGTVGCYDIKYYGHLLGF